MADGSSGLWRWIAWGVVVCALIGMFKVGLEPWDSPAAIGGNLGVLVAVLLCGSFAGGVAWTIRRWLRRGLPADL
jgi:hypothetical protein